MDAKPVMGYTSTDDHFAGQDCHGYEKLLHFEIGGPGAVCEELANVLFAFWCNRLIPSSKPNEKNEFDG